MKRLLINTAFPDELRIAQVERGHLRNLEVEDLSHSRLQNSLYKARVTDLSSSLEAAFIDFGEERNGFLPLKNIAEEYYSHLPEGARSIQDVLNTGDDIIVQVRVDKSEHENKGALLTTIISLPGNYLVLHPNAPGINLPRNLSGENRNKAQALLARLRLPDGMGMILRTQGLQQDISVLQDELDLLAGLWHQVRSGAAECSVPTLLLHEPVALFRALRDYLDERVEEIIVDSPKAYRSILTWLQNFKPSFVERLILYEEPLPLFTRYQVEEDAQGIYKRRAPLASGGSLIIDHTEAMTAIDINSGAAKGRDMEDTAYRTNLEAAVEIARQLRLRDIGGQIVVDFIDMRSEENRKQVNKRLQEALRSDPARPNIGVISDFGLLSMTRKRLRPSVEEAYTKACPHCDGWGRQRIGKSLAMSVLRELEVKAAEAETGEIVAQVPAPLSAFLFNEYRRSLLAIEQYFNTSITVIPSLRLSGSHYEMRAYKRPLGTDAMMEKIKQEERRHAEKERQQDAQRQQRLTRQRKRPALRHPHDDSETTRQEAASPPRRWRLLSLLGKFFGTGASTAASVANKGRRTSESSTSGERRRSQPGNGSRQRNRSRRPQDRERRGQGTRDGSRRQPRQRSSDIARGQHTQRPASGTAAAGRTQEPSHSSRMNRGGQNQGAARLGRRAQASSERGAQEREHRPGRQSMPSAPETEAVSDNFYLRRRAHTTAEEESPNRAPREQRPMRRPERRDRPPPYQNGTAGDSPDQGPGAKRPMRRPERRDRPPPYQNGTAGDSPDQGPGAKRPMHRPERQDRPPPYQNGTAGDSPDQGPGAKRPMRRPERRDRPPPYQNGTAGDSPDQGPGAKRPMRRPERRDRPPPYQNGTAGDNHRPSERRPVRPEEAAPLQHQDQRETAAPSASRRADSNPRLKPQQQEKPAIQSQELTAPGKSGDERPPRPQQPTPPAPPVQRAPNDPRGPK